MQDKKAFLRLLKQCQFLYASDLLEDAANCLREMFSYLEKSARVRDEWSFEWHELPYGISVIATSEKKGHEYDIGIYSSNLYINSTLYEPELLKNMKAEFWSVLASLDLMDCFSFEENAGINGNVNFDLKTGKSSTYTLIRNYILLEEHNEFGATDIGSLESSWHLDESEDLLYQQAVESLKGIYRLNYLLYRLEYTRNHGKKN